MTENEPDTELTPTAQAPEVPEAWSADDSDQAGYADAYPDQPRRHGPIVSLGLVALVVGVIGSVILLAATFFNWDESKQAAPSQINKAPTPTIPVAGAPPASSVAPAPAPPTTVTVPAAPPPTVTSAPGPSVYDQNFLTLMSQEGWGCTDNSDAEQCKKEMLSFAHQICSYSGQPIDLIYQNFGLPSFFGPREERRAIANAEQAYPNCTFTGSP